jgi:predicted RNase H-like nuclease (RuvC/YqgF family)
MNNNDNLLLDAMKNIGKLELEIKKLKSSLNRLKTSSKDDNHSLKKFIKFHNILSDDVNRDCTKISYLDRRIRKLEEKMADETKA